MENGLWAFIRYSGPAATMQGVHLPASSIYTDCDPGS